MLKIVFLIAIFFGNISHAYIPKYEMIISRTAGNHGVGLYLIDQTVTIYGPNSEPVLIEEQWLIDNENKLRLRAIGKKNLLDQMDLTFVYSGERKSFLDAKGQRKTSAAGENWSLEPIFYARSTDYLNRLLNKMSIIPSSELAHKPTPTKLEDFSHAPESFVRLGRVAGVVSYAIGTPTPVASSTKNPGIWIEQDLFVIRKVRFKSGAEVLASKFKRQRNSLWLPEEREIVWGDYRAQINVNRVRTYSASATLNKRLSATSLDLKSEPHLAIKFPENNLVKEFYENFR